MYLLKVSRFRDTFNRYICPGYAAGMGTVPGNTPVKGKKKGAAANFANSPLIDIF